MNVNAGALCTRKFITMSGSQQNLINYIAHTLSVSLHVSLHVHMSIYMRTACVSVCMNVHMNVQNHQRALSLMA